MNLVRRVYERVLLFSQGKGHLEFPDPERLPTRLSLLRMLFGLEALVSGLETAVDTVGWSIWADRGFCPVVPIRFSSAWTGISPPLRFLADRNYWREQGESRLRLNSLKSCFLPTTLSRYPWRMQRALESAYTGQENLPTRERMSPIRSLDPLRLFALENHEWMPHEVNLTLNLWDHLTKLHQELLKRRSRLQVSLQPVDRSTSHLALHYAEEALAGDYFAPPTSGWPVSIERRILNALTGDSEMANAVRAAEAVLPRLEALLQRPLPRQGRK